MKRFRCYRPHPPAEYYDQGAANPPDEPQFEGVVFDDGTVCQHWLTVGKSHVIWPSFSDLMTIHGHPEYGTRFEWPDGTLDEQEKVSGEDPLQEYRDALDAHNRVLGECERTQRMVDRARDAVAARNPRNPPPRL